MSEQQEPDTPAKERGDALYNEALQSHGYLDDEGVLVEDLMVDKLVEHVVQAEANSLSDRKKVAIKRTPLTGIVFPNLPGPGDYQQEDDPEGAEAAWTIANEKVWRLCDANAEGYVQSRLNGEHAVMLCRTKATDEKGVWGVYVTRNWACILEDLVSPGQKRIANAIAQLSRNSEMGTSRLPEHGKKFKSQLKSATNNALTTGVALVDRQIEAASTDSPAPGETEDA